MNWRQQEDKSGGLVQECNDGSLGEGEVMDLGTTIRFQRRKIRASISNLLKEPYAFPWLSSLLSLRNKSH